MKNKRLLTVASALLLYPFIGLGQAPNMGSTIMYYLPLRVELETQAFRTLQAT